MRKKTPKYRRGSIVILPGKWIHRLGTKNEGTRSGKAIVLESTARRLVLCSFNPGKRLGHDNPHVGQYVPRALQVVGKVKMIPPACKYTFTWKERFWEAHPSVGYPKPLAGVKRHRKRR